jgi:hypothetical protein
MKINQLFRRHVDRDVVDRVASCFGLDGIDDARTWSKRDFGLHDTVARMLALRDELAEYYIPCKAALYVDTMASDPQKCVTVLKQLLRLHGRSLAHREKNVRGKKVIIYRIRREGSEDAPPDAHGCRIKTLGQAGALVVTFNG